MYIINKSYGIKCCESSIKVLQYKSELGLISKRLETLKIVLNFLEFLMISVWCLCFFIYPSVGYYLFMFSFIIIPLIIKFFNLLKYKTEEKIDQLYFNKNLIKVKYGFRLSSNIIPNQKIEQSKDELVESLFSNFEVSNFINLENPVEFIGILIRTKNVDKEKENFALTLKGHKSRFLRRVSDDLYDLSFTNSALVLILKNKCIYPIIDNQMVFEINSVNNVHDTIKLYQFIFSHYEYQKNENLLFQGNIDIICDLGVIINQYSIAGSIEHILIRSTNGRTKRVIFNTLDNEPIIYEL